MASASDNELVPVWLLASDFEPRGSSLYTIRLALHLPEYGFSPVIVCHDSRRIPSKVRETVPIIEVPRLAARLLGSLGIRQLVKEYASKPPRLIHAQRRNLDLIAVELAQEFRVPYLITIHDRIPAEQSLRIYPQYLGAVIAVSPSIERDLVLGAGVPAEVVRVVPSGVDVPANLSLPPPRNTRHVPVVGTASALEPVKGLTYFLLAAELILSSGYDVEFLIAGSGPDEEVLRHAAQHLDIANRVTFATHVTRYTEVIDTVDLFVVPSLEQGLGTVMLEAMAHGKPVVATQVGGIADFLVDGTHALLVPKANHVILADKIKFLLDNPEKARVLAANAQGLVRDRFSIERMTSETCEIYRSILEDASSGRFASQVGEEEE